MLQQQFCHFGGYALLAWYHRYKTSRVMMIPLWVKRILTRVKGILNGVKWDTEWCERNTEWGKRDWMQRKRYWTWWKEYWLKGIVKLILGGANLRPYKPWTRHTDKKLKVTVYKNQHLTKIIFCIFSYFEKGHLWSILAPLWWEIDICAHWLFRTKLSAQVLLFEAFFDIMHIFSTIQP